jgi:hypothetical protein
VRGSLHLANRVVAARIPRVAAGDSTHSHPAPSKQAVLADRLFGILRTGRLEATDRWSPGKQTAIEPDEPDADRFHGTVRPPRTPPRRRRLCTAPVNASKSAEMTGGRAMIRTSQPGWNEGAITLSTSRSRLRTRFRTTAPPSFRPVDNPKRVTSRSVRRTRTTSRAWDLTVPSFCNAAKSLALESITIRGEFWPRSGVRLLASCGRARGGRPESGVPQWSSSGLGSRVPWRDASSWAGRSASSEVRGCLSIQASGSAYP